MTASMSWELDREHEEFRARVRAFVDRQVRPVAELLRTARSRHEISPDAYWTWVVHSVAGLPKTRTGKIMRRLLRDVVEHGGPQGDTGAMEDLAGLQAVQQAVAAEAAPTA